MSEFDPTAEADTDTETGADGDPESGPAADTDGEPGRCAEPDCERPAAVRVHVPWEEDRNVCLAHGRALSAQDGVVAIPLDPDGHSEEWP